MEKHVLRTLFIKTFYLSAVTFGGGYVIISFMKTIFVDELHWIEEDEMLDMVAIAQAGPGSVAVNGAIIVGYKLAGFPGMMIATLGAISPPLIILVILTNIYNLICNNVYVSAMLDGMQAGVAAVILSVSWDMLVKLKSGKHKAISYMIVVAAFVASYWFKVSAIWLILICGVLGLIYSFITAGKEAKV